MNEEKAESSTIQIWSQSVLIYSGYWGVGTRKAQRKEVCVPLCPPAMKQKGR